MSQAAIQQTEQKLHALYTALIFSRPGNNSEYSQADQDYWVVKNYADPQKLEFAIAPIERELKVTVEQEADDWLDRRIKIDHPGLRRRMKRYQEVHAERWEEALVVGAEQLAKRRKKAIAKLLDLKQQVEANSAKLQHWIEELEKMVAELRSLGQPATYEDRYLDAIQTIKARIETYQNLYLSKIAELANQDAVLENPICKLDTAEVGEAIASTEELAEIVQIEVASDRPYPEFFKPRQDWPQRHLDEARLIQNPVKSRYFNDFENALDDADLYTIKSVIQELEQQESAKTKIKVLQRRQKQLESELEEIEIKDGNWRGVLTPDLSQGIHLTFESPFGSKWMHHIIDSESIWEVADYFHARMQRHFSGDDAFVGSKDWNIVVRLRENPAPPVNRVQVKAGDRVRLHKEFLPETLEWNGGVKGEVGECVVYSAQTADGIYFGKRGVIVEVLDEDTFNTKFDGKIEGYSGDCFTIPVSRSAIDRRLKPRELNEDVVFDVLLVHSLGIELSYEGSREYRVLSNAIREVLPENPPDPLSINGSDENLQEESEHENKDTAGDRSHTKRPKPKFQQGQNVILRRNIPPVLKGSEVTILQHKRKCGEYCYEIKDKKEAIWAYECDLNEKSESVIASEINKNKGSLKQITRLRSAANNLTSDIETVQKITSGSAVVCRRDKHPAQHPIDYVKRMTQVQAGLRAIADHMEAGTCPEILRGIYAKVHVEDLLFPHSSYSDSSVLSNIFKGDRTKFETAQRELAALISNEPQLPNETTQLGPEPDRLREDLPVSHTEELDNDLAGKPVRFELYTQMRTGIATGFQTKTHVEVQYSTGTDKPDAKVKIPRTDLIEIDGQYVEHPEYQEGDRVRIVDAVVHPKDLIGQSATVIRVFRKVVRLKVQDGKEWTFYQHEVEPIEQAEVEEDAPGDIAAALLEALRQQGGLNRWDALKAQGATDNEIQQVLSRIFGEGCGSSEPHWWSAKGGGNPRFWNQIVSTGQPDLQGKQLVQRVRELLEIPQLKTPTVETFEALDAEYAEALEQTSSVINLSRQIQDDPFGDAAAVLESGSSFIRHIGGSKQRLCGVREGPYYLASHLTPWQAEAMTSLCPECLSVWRSQSNQSPEPKLESGTEERITVSDRPTNPGEPIVKVWRQFEGTWYYAGQMGYQSKVTLRPGDITCLPDIDPNLETPVLPAETPNIEPPPVQVEKVAIEQPPTEPPLPCQHPRAVIGLDGATCPDCKKTFNEGTREYSRLINQDATKTFALKIKPEAIASSSKSSSGKSKITDGNSAPIGQLSLF